MPRPDISVPRPTENIYFATFGNRGSLYVLLSVITILAVLIAGSFNSIAAIISCSILIFGGMAIAGKTNMAKNRK